jgi:hypothetical protein
MSNTKVTRLEQSEADPTPSTETNEPTSPKRFSVEALRLDLQEEMVGVEKVTTNVLIRKPKRQEWLRTHPTFHMDTAILELEQDREVYMVDRGLRAALAEELKRVTLWATINRTGALFLWPLSLPDAKGKRNPWSESARRGAELAQHCWVRVSSNMANGQYDIGKAVSVMSDPEWPKLSFDEILEIAFKDAWIDSMDHPAVKTLRGAS